MYSRICGCMNERTCPEKHIAAWHDATAPGTMNPRKTCMIIGCTVAQHGPRTIAMESYETRSNLTGMSSCGTCRDTNGHHIQPSYDIHFHLHVRFIYEFRWHVPRHEWPSYPLELPVHAKFHFRPLSIPRLRLILWITG